ncbi:hypothetical protein ACPV5U_24335 [Vibrio mediterranei]
MSIGIIDKFSVVLTNLEQKLSLLDDIEDQLRDDTPITEIANDLVKFGTGIDVIVGKQIQETLGASKPVYQAFDGILNDITVQTIKSGEEADDLARGFADAQNSLRASEGHFFSLIKAFLVPMVKIMGLIIGFGYGGEFAYGQMKMLAPVQTWPAISQWIYELSTSIYANQLLIVVGFILVPIVTYGIITFWLGDSRRFIDKFPFFKQYRLLTASASLNSLATLIASDTPIRESVEFMQERASGYGAYHLERMIEQIGHNTGKGNVGYALDTGLINAREITRLKRLSTDVDLSIKLQNMSVTHSKQLVAQIKRIESVTTILWPFMMYGSLLIFGGSIIMMAMSIRF